MLVGEVLDVERDGHLLGQRVGDGGIEQGLAGLEDDITPSRINACEN